MLVILYSAFPMVACHHQALNSEVWAVEGGKWNPLVNNIVWAIYPAVSVCGYILLLICQALVMHSPSLGCNKQGLGNKHFKEYSLGARDDS